MSKDEGQVSDLGTCQGPDPLSVTPIQNSIKIEYFSQKPQFLENLARP